MTINIIDLHKNDIKLKIYDIINNSTDLIDTGLSENQNQTVGPISINTVGSSLGGYYTLREAPVDPIITSNPWIEINYHIPGINRIGDRLIHPSINLRDDSSNPNIITSPWQQSSIIPDMIVRPLL